MIQESISELVDELSHIEDISDSRLQHWFEEYTDLDLALVLESLPPDARLAFWAKIPQSLKIDILVAMRSEPRGFLIKQTSEADILSLFSDLEADDLIELDESLPERLVDQILLKMDVKQRHFYEMALEYKESQVGHWLNPDILVVSQTTRTIDALRVLRRHVPDYTEVIYLVNRAGNWMGCVSITRLINAPQHAMVFELRESDYPVLPADLDCYEAAERVERSAWAALPVVNEDNVLLGRLDVGTAMVLLREESEFQLMSSAGLDEDADLFAPVKRSAKDRALWLGINLVTAFLASWCIGLFEDSLQTVVALAILMPIVASMGGVAGMQTATLMIRALALGQITGSNIWALLVKEMKVGFLNGFLWASVVGVLSALWFQHLMLGVVIGIALVMNILIAAASGVLVPLTLDKMNIDPALSGSVVLTTLTDCLGFLIFLGLGSFLLLP
jgi:magnesium transporter